MNWKDWHDNYELSNAMKVRLATVQALIAKTLAQRPPGPISVASICAGDGRDLIPTIATSPRREDIQGILLDVDEDLVRSGRSAIVAHGLESQLAFFRRDATQRRSYQDIGPSSVVVACGIFGNLLPKDEDLFVNVLAALCARNGQVVWTRNRCVSDGDTAIPRIQRLLRAKGFVERCVEHVPEYVIACHEQEREPTALPAADQLFSFTPFSEFPRHRPSLPARMANLFRRYVLANR